MQKKEYEEFFRKLPRKELQSLCKKCGLPARKSSSHMVESLLFYFQRKGYILSDKWISGNQEALHQTPVVPVRTDSSLNRNGNAIRDTVGFNEAAQFQFSSKYAPQVCSGNVNSGVNSSMETSTRVPAFEFFVSSEEGLNLCVDLSSSPSDWIKKCKDQVNLCENLSTEKSCSLHHELGRMENSNNKQMNGSPSPEMEENFHVALHPDGLHPDGGNTMLLPSCHEEVNALGCSGKDQVPILLKSNPVVQNFTAPNAEVDIRNGHSGILDSDMTDTPIEKTACNFGVNSSSDGSVDLNAVDHQNLKPDDEVCENSTMQDSCNEKNTSIAPDNQNSKPDDKICENSAIRDSCNLNNNSVVFVECLTDRSAGMELSEAGKHNKDTPYPPQKNKEFFYLMDMGNNMRTGLDGLANSSDVVPSRNPDLSCSDEQLLSNGFNRRESSVCSEVNYSSEKTCLKSDNLESNKGSQRKRLRVDSESLSDCSNMKIVRSMNHSAEEVLPRRSTRLVSK